MKDKKVPHRNESLGRKSAHPQQREMDPAHSTGGGRGAPRGQTKQAPLRDSKGCRKEKVMEGLAAWGVKTGKAGQQGVGDGRSGPLR